MNPWDVLLFILILAVVAWAIRHCIMMKKRGGSCCGDCAKCSGCTDCRKGAR